MKKRNTQVVTVSLPLDLLEVLEEYREERNIGKSAAMREVLEMGVACLRDREG